MNPTDEMRDLFKQLPAGGRERVLRAAQWLAANPDSDDFCSLAMAAGISEARAQRLLGSDDHDRGITLVAVAVGLAGVLLGATWPV